MSTCIQHEYTRTSAAALPVSASSSRCRNTAASPFNLSRSSPSSCRKLASLSSKRDFMPRSSPSTYLERCARAPRGRSGGVNTKRNLFAIVECVVHFSSYGRVWTAPKQRMSHFPPEGRAYHACMKKLRETGGTKKLVATASGFAKPRGTGKQTEASQDKQ